MKLRFERRAYSWSYRCPGIHGEVARLERAILLHHLMKNLNSAFEFPMARRDPNSGYTLHGRWFNDPYAWLERLDDPETEAWIAAQEAVTHSVLSAVPGRDWLRAAVARSRRYSQLSPPILAGPTGRVGVLLCGLSRAGRGALGRGGALERHLRAPPRVRRAGPPGLRRRPCEALLVRGRGQRVRPLLRPLQVGLRARQRGLPAAARRRRVGAGGSCHAVRQPGAGCRGQAPRPHRSRCAARTSLRRAADGTD